MVLGGDELGRTQGGNNNAYCQDNEISWFDWDSVDEDMLAFTKTVLALRRNNPALRPRDYLRGPDGGPKQMVLYRPDGKPMAPEDWQDPSAHSLAVALDGRLIEDADGETSSDRFLLLLNAHYEPVTFTIPVGRRGWKAVLTSSGPDDTPQITSTGTITVEPRALLLLHSRAGG
jgi:glycogen operon protein